MKKLFLATVAISTLSIAATSAMADHHESGENHHKKKMIERVDVNADGRISKAEFLVKQESVFAKMDKDSDGFLSRDEMQDAKGKMKEKREKMRDRMKNKASE